ncbi:hypothetical protein EW146_g9496 [Bondarzewia mesenterica]|uniref:Uncharacterized protein n=1 Tax=Bondarzewia mesenterica TaxID=1095465 RepID=A0A4S4LAZ2_9AGAM|nr:hypothetical protein EW146_g9496 [Bondarzewia mesenterica]
MSNGIPIIIRVSMSSISRVDELAPTSPNYPTTSLITSSVTTSPTFSSFTVAETPSPYMFVNAILETDNVWQICSEPRRHIEIGLQIEARLFEDDNESKLQGMWGSDDTFHPSKSNLLCKQSDDRPLIIWTVGDLTKTWLYDMQGNPAARILVTIAPLNVSTLNAARSLIHSLSDNTTALSDPKPFTKVYDAIHTYKDKKKIKTIALEDLQEGDVVLVEPTISRYKVKKESTKQNAANEAWQATFELQSVSLLQKAPASYDICEVSRVTDEI